MADRASDGVCRGFSQLLGGLGRVRLEMGATAEAKDAFEQVLELQSMSQHEGSVAQTISDLALAELGLGNEERALNLSDESLRLARLETVEPSPALAYALHRRAELLYRKGDLEKAKEQAFQAITLYEALGETRMDAELRDFLDQLNDE